MTGKRKILTALALCCALALAALLLMPKESPENSENPEKQVYEKTMTAFSEYPAFSSLDELKESASLAVLGEWEEFSGTYNVTRDPKDPSKESGESYSEGREYSFKVKEVLYGSLSEKSIDVGIKASDGFDFDGVEVQVPSQYFYEPEMGETRVLFLSFDENTGLYYPCGRPWEIAVGQGEELNFCMPPQAEQAEAEAETADGIYRMTVKYGSSQSPSDFVSSMTLNELRLALGE